MKFSIVIPVLNEPEYIYKCLKALINQDYDKTKFEIIIINDGSTDNTKDVIDAFIQLHLDFDIKLINLSVNQGRYLARETGVKASQYNNIFFIDSRCIADRELLKNAVKAKYLPLMGNVIFDTKKNPYYRFAYLIRKVIYGKNQFGQHFHDFYLDTNNFEDTAKGTGVFACSKELLQNSSLSVKNKYISDDTKLLKNIVGKKKILKTSRVKVTYYPRTSLKQEILHTFNTGPTFIDYYFNLKLKRFWLYIFLPFFIMVGIIIVLLLNIFSVVNVLSFLFITLCLFAIIMSETVTDFFTVIFLLPLLVISFMLGNAKGIWLKLRGIL